MASLVFANAADGGAADANDARRASHSGLRNLTLAFSPITVRRVASPQIQAVDEGRHRQGPSPDWEESWYLDFVAADGSLAGYLRLALRPADGQAWFWAGVVGGGPPLVSVRDHEVPLPSGPGLEVRASGLWTELVCETPLEHWSVGLEAFGVALDDPLDAWGAERGDPWALGLDVEWEALGSCQPADGGGGYQQACAVHGDVLVGAERFQLDGSGIRAHLWGAQEWRDPTWRATGRLHDGTWFVTGGEGDGPVDVDGDGLLRTGELRTAGADLTAAAIAHAPVLIPGDGRLARALCRYDAIDGRHGFGWAERFHPTANARGRQPLRRRGAP